MYKWSFSSYHLPIGKNNKFILKAITQNLLTLSMGASPKSHS